MDHFRWLLLNQLLEDISALNFASEDSTRCLSQLVLELALDPTYIKPMNLQRLAEETFSCHLEILGEQELLR